MALELYVWGAAFGLPSIDPDCLGAITYLAVALPRESWTLIATSPSAVPRNLPALRDATSDRWVASGFEDLVAYFRTSAASDSLDAGLTPAQAADTAAYCAFLHADAAPLLALSLYVSSANWAATTRPAYSQLLPFPLTWIEPPAIRADHAAAAAHLGLSSLDTDAEDERAAAAASASAHGLSASLSAAATQVFPDRLRAAMTAGTGRYSANSPVGGTTATSSVVRALTPEARTQIRLDDAARSCLSVLASLKGDKRLFLRADSSDRLHPSALDCLAFGYLALMSLPDVPRPFLRDALQRHHPDLAVFVADMRQAAFGSAALPWQTSPTRTVPAPLTPFWLRVVHGIVHAIPGLGGEWMIWLYRTMRIDGSEQDDGFWRQDVAVARRRRLVTLSTTLATVALAAGLLTGYRRLPPFGAPIMVFSRTPRTALLGLGAAGTFLSAL